MLRLGTQSLGRYAMKKYIGVILALVLPVSYAQAGTIDFNCISPSPNCSAKEHLFTLGVSEQVPGSTFFRLSVANGPKAFVKSIFFDDQNMLLDPTPTNYQFDFNGGKQQAGGVSFAAFNVPGGNFPQGSNVSFTSDFSTSANSPRGNKKNGIDNGEWLGITFLNTSAALILSALSSGELRLGIHVGAAGSLITAAASQPTVVPIPAAALLFGSALMGFFGVSLVGRKSSKAS